MLKKLLIQGMSCAHCVMHVQNALREVDGVTGATADLKTNSAVVEMSRDVPDEELIRAVEEAGYDVTGTEMVP